MMPASRPAATRLLCVFGVVLAFASVPAGAQGLWDEDDTLDCVMEPRSLVKIGSPEEGILEHLAVERGDLIETGEVVARLDDTLETFAVELGRLRTERDMDVASSRIRLQYSRRELDRAKALNDRAMLAAKTRDEAEVEAQLARYALRAAELDRRLAQIDFQQAKAHLERRTIHSPVKGVVVDVEMSPGEYVYEQSPVMTVAEIDPLNVEVFVPISRYRTVRVGMPAEVRPVDPIGGVYEARVSVVDRVFDAASGTFGVRLQLPNPDYGLPAGIKCTVRFLDEPTAASVPP